MDRLLRTLDNAASRFDESVLSPRWVAGKARQRFFDRRRRCAETNPAWRAIEDRRHVDGRPSSIFISEEAGLGWPEWEEQNRIEEELTPRPWWLPLAEWVDNARLTVPVNVIQERNQRATRGFTDSDVWNMSTRLCGRIAEMLDVLADESHGWPDNVYETFEEYVAALREHAGVLRAYAEGDDSGWESEWLRLASDPATADEAKSFLLDHNAAEVARLEAAQQSMHWVADHLNELWD